MIPSSLDKVFYTQNDFHDESEYQKILEILSSDFLFSIVRSDGTVSIKLSDKLFNNPNEMELADKFFSNPILVMYSIKKEIEDNNILGVPFIRFKLMQDLTKDKPAFFDKFPVIKSYESVGKLILSKGIILSTSDVSRKVVVFAYENEQTGDIIYTVSPKPPKGYIYNSRKSVKMDVIKIIVQEEDTLGKMKPETLTLNYYFNAKLYDDVLNKLQPGNMIYFYTIPIVHKVEKNHRLEFKDEYIMVDFNTVEESFDEVKLTEEDEKKILEMSKDDNIINNLVQSFAPELRHIDRVKEAVLVSLFGGVGDGKLKRDLGNVHVLLIGEPGVGKTKLMMDAMELVPKSAFVDGVHVTKAGMLASLVKNEDMFMLEAGALLLANDGFLFLDEFDKMDKEAKYSLLEAMQSGEVFFNKVIKFKFKVNTTVIASMNPTVSDIEEAPIDTQIDFNDPIVTRFAIKMFVRKIDSDEVYKDIIDVNLSSEDDVLKTVVYTKEMLMKYIAYARKNIRPELTDTARERLKQIVYSLMKSDRRINNRVVTQMKQISTAYAKMRLSDKVTVEDVDRAFDLIKYALSTLNISVMEYFGSANNIEKKDLRQEILSIVPTNQPIETSEIYRKLSGKYPVDRIHKYIDYMIQAGDLLYPRHGYLMRAYSTPVEDVSGGLDKLGD